jgi:outer membrane protein assembly factor BamE (lipoprotein component of BamABCDE complex)
MMGVLHSVEVWMAAMAATIAILTGFGIFARWCAFSPAVSHWKLEQLRVGMTMDEVKSLLGAARDQSHQNNGVTQWVYGARMKRHILIIEFSDKLVLQSFAHGVPDRRRAAASFKGS